MLRSNMVKRFLETRRQAQGDLDDLLGPSDKIDKLNLRTKRMEYAIYHMASNHSLDKVTEFYESHDRKISHSLPKVRRRSSVEDTIVRMRRGSLGVITDDAAKHGSSTNTQGQMGRYQSKTCNAYANAGFGLAPILIPENTTPKRTLSDVPESPDLDAVHPFSAPDGAPDLQEEVLPSDLSLNSGLKDRDAGMALLSSAPGSANHQRKPPSTAFSENNDVVLARLGKVEEQVAAMQVLQEERIARLEQQLTAMQEAQRDSTADILQAIRAMQGKG